MESSGLSPAEVVLRLLEVIEEDIVPITTYVRMIFQNVKDAENLSAQFCSHTTATPCLRHFPALFPSTLTLTMGRSVVWVPV